MEQSRGTASEQNHRLLLVHFFRTHMHVHIHKLYILQTFRPTRTTDECYYSTQRNVKTKPRAPKFIKLFHMQIRHFCNSDGTHMGNRCMYRVQVKAFDINRYGCRPLNVAETTTPVCSGLNRSVQYQPYSERTGVARAQNKRLLKSGYDADLALVCVCMYVHWIGFCLRVLFTN